MQISNSSGQAIADRIQRFLEQRQSQPPGIFLKEVLSISRSQAYRKLSGDSPMTVAELAKIAEHFSVSVEALLGEEAATHNGAGEGKQVVDGLFCVGSHRLTCRLEVSSEPCALSLLRQTRSVYVAERPSAAEPWTTYLLADAPEATNTALHRVMHMEMTVTAPAPALTVAVLDNEPAVRNTVCELLKNLGYASKPFDSAEALEEAAKVDNFDAYLLDWNLGGTTSEQIIKKLRAGSGTRAPILLLTGVVDQEHTEIGRVMQQYGISKVCIKPVTGPAIALNIKTEIAAMADMPRAIAG